MQILDELGDPLRAALDLALDNNGGSLEIVLHSAGGRGSQSGESRNPDYPTALSLLLRRLGAVSASLKDVSVDSPRARAEPAEARRVNPAPWEYPIALDDVDDYGALRLALTRPQKDIASRAGGGGGNERKRLRLRVDLAAAMTPVQVYGALQVIDADDPGEAYFAAPAEVRDSGTALLRRLIGEDLQTLTGRPNRILGVTPPYALVATDRSPEGQPVPIEDVSAALETLRSRGQVDITPAAIGHRSAFIGAVLSTLPGTQVSLDPARVSLVRGEFEVGDRTITHEGATDRPATRQERREQSRLRSALLGEADHATCAICGEDYPARFLWASHIKTRKACTEEERRDLHNIAMLACLFGCDALYEHGYLCIDEAGQVQTSEALLAEPGLLSRAGSLSGKKCRAHGPRTAEYFRWHRENRYLGD
jgi:hypothetical protein